MDIIRYKMIYKYENNQENEKENEEGYEEEKGEGYEEENEEEYEDEYEESSEEEIEENYILKVLGKVFVKTNQNKCKLVINNRKRELKEFISFKKIKGNKIKLYMIISRDLCDGSYMFKDCKSLLTISNCPNKKDFFNDEEIFNPNDLEQSFISELNNNIGNIDSEKDFYSNSKEEKDINSPSKIVNNNENNKSTNRLSFLNMIYNNSISPEKYLLIVKKCFQIVNH